MPRAGRAAWSAAVAIVVGVAVAAGFMREFSGDFHWHLVLGDYVLDQVSLPGTDSFSHTFAGEPYLLSSWLADTLFSLAFRGLGWAGCYLLRALALAVMGVALLLECRRRGVGPLGAAALVAGLFAASLFRFHLRPEVFAFALLAIVLLLCGEHERTSRARYLGGALALFPLWANLHGSVSLGLAALGLYCAQRVLGEAFARDRARDRRVLAWCLAAPPAAFLLACLGPEGYHMPLAIEVVSEIWVSTVREWTPLPLYALTPLVKAAALATGVTALFALLLTRRISLWHLALVAILAAVTVKYQRFVTFALIAGIPLLASNLAAIGRGLAELPRARAWRVTGGVMAGGLLSASLGSLLVDRELHREVGLGLDQSSRAFPSGACRFVREADAPGPIFNSYVFGSYLMHCLGPDYPVFIDGRAWSLYTDAFYARYRRAGRSQEELEALLAEYPVKWSIVAYDPFALRFAAAEEDWRLVYFDDKALVYADARAPELAPVREESGFVHLDPSRFSALPSLRGPKLEAAEQELARQKRACPACRRTLLARAAVAVAAADEERFRRARDRILETSEPRELPFLAALNARRHGRHPEAAAFFARWRAAGGDPVISTIEQARELVAAGRLDEARALLEPRRAPPGAARVFERARDDLLSR